jgi:hypothetical protein
MNSEFQNIWEKWLWLSQGLISEHNSMIEEKVVANRRQNIRPCSDSNREPAKYLSKTALLFCWSWHIGNGERSVIADSHSGNKRIWI